MISRKKHKREKSKVFDGKPSPGFAVSGLGVTHRSMKGAESGGPGGQELSGAAHSPSG